MHICIYMSKQSFPKTDKVNRQTESVQNRLFPKEAGMYKLPINKTEIISQWLRGRLLKKLSWENWIGI